MDTAFQLPIRHLQLVSLQARLPQSQTTHGHIHTHTALEKPLLPSVLLHVMRPKRNLGMSPLILATQDKSHLGTSQSQLPFVWLSAVCRHPATTFFTTHPHIDLPSLLCPCRSLSSNTVGCRRQCRTPKVRLLFLCPPPSPLPPPSSPTLSPPRPKVWPTPTARHVFQQQTCTAFGSVLCITTFSASFRLSVSTVRHRQKKMEATRARGQWGTRLVLPLAAFNIPSPLGLQLGECELLRSD